MRHFVPIVVPLILAFASADLIAQSIARQTYQHSLAVAPDGTAWSWGRNDYGQLGIGTAGNDQPLPLPVAGLTNIVAARSGLEHSLFLRDDGTVWVSGRNEVGQLGNGSICNSSTPVQVVGINNALAVAGLDRSCFALLSDGTVRAWGDNSSGIFGTGIGPGSGVPVQVPNLSGIVAIEGGAYHGIALRNDGIVFTWGGNSNGGPLGNGAPPGVDGNAPAPVIGLSDVVSISAGAWNSSALKSDGTVWTWGSNAYGQLGRGTPSSVAAPVPGLTNVTQIAGGSYHVLALRGDGTVWAWGYNYFGEIGNGNQGNVGAPTQVLNLSSVLEIAAGSYHSIARLADGTLRSWGRNVEGELGNNTVGTPTTSPVPVIGLSLPDPPVFGLGPVASGNVGIDYGQIFDVLFVNGSIGGSPRRVDIPVGGAMTITVAQPSTNPFIAPFAIFGYVGVPTSADVTVLPYGPGSMCFPPHVLNPNYPGTFTLVNSLPPIPPYIFPALVGGGPTPWNLMVNGLPFPFQFALQGVILEDPATFRVTNGVLVNIQ